MAAATGKILLGIADEFMDENDDKICGWTTNKFGGSPNWTYGPPEDYPCCKMCQQPLYLISQVYCPLEDSEYHRVLYVFGCVSRHCWNKVESWRIIRSQVLDVTSKEEKPKVNHFDTGQWCDDADDWCDDANDWCDEGTVPEVDDLKPEVDQSMRSLEQLTGKLNIQESDSILTSTRQDDLTHCPMFTPVYINVFEEPDHKSPSLTKHEKRLLEQYKMHSDIPTLDDEPSRGGGGEGFEKTEIKHGDKTFYKFQKRITVCPQQCLRYHKDGQPLMMTDTPSNSDLSPKLIPCSICGRKRTFELQLMPALVSVLHSSQTSTNSERDVSTDSSDVSLNGNCEKDVVSDSSRCTMEFGTVLVYTCAASCWREGQKYVDELVFVIPDPETELLKKLF